MTGRRAVEPEYLIGNQSKNSFFLPTSRPQFTQLSPSTNTSSESHSGQQR